MGTVVINQTKEYFQRFFISAWAKTRGSPNTLPVRQKLNWTLIHLNFNSNQQNKQNVNSELFMYTFFLGRKLLTDAGQNTSTDDRL